MIDIKSIDFTYSKLCIYTSKRVMSLPVGFLDVLNSDWNTLGQNLSSYSLVNDDTNGMFGYIEYTASFTMVGFMWHTFLESTASLSKQISLH